MGDQQQIDWSPDGATLFFQRDGNLWAQLVSGGEAMQITHFDEPIGDYEWSKDGQILACTRTTTLSDAVILSIR